MNDRRSLILVVLLVQLFLVPTVVFLVPEPVEAVGDLVLLEHGSVRYEGGGTYTYSTVLGEYNTYDGSRYNYYLYDDDRHSVEFAGHTLRLYDWYATFENESQVLVDDVRWVVQYWRTQGQGSWRELDLWEHSYLPVIEGNNFLTFGQRYTDGFSVLDVWYAVRNYDQVKITLNFTAYEARTYRFVWQFTGVDGEPDTLPNGVEFGDVNIGWGDSELDATYEWWAGNRKCDVTFDEIVMGAGQTFVLDPSVHPVLAADSDDDWWNTATDTHYVSSTEDYIRDDAGDEYDYAAQARFALAIVKDATINSANVSFYDEYDGASETAKMWRIDEANCGSLEGDASMPAVDESEYDNVDFDNSVGWDTYDITTITQSQINLAGWSSGNYLGMRCNFTSTSGSHDWYDYQHANSYHPYMNVTYTIEAANNAPSNDGCTLEDPDDSDNLYALYKDYTFTSNVSDADGFADIDYIEMSCYSGSAYWTVRYDEDIDTFSEEAGASYITLQGASAAVEAGNDIDVTWEIQIEWAHGDLTNYDLRQYVVDDEPESDTDDYDLNYDYETRLDITTGPTLSDGTGTVDRGDYNQLDSVTASGTIDYYNSAISPDSGDVDVWISCTDVAGGPWSDLTLSAGAFSTTVDSDDIVGLDSYTFKVVAEGGGAGGTDLSHATHTDTYIADRLQVTITADDTSVINGTQVNFTLTVVYDYDNSAFGEYVVNITNDAVAWYNFNSGNVSLFNDTDADTTNVYTASDCWNESTHGITEFTSNSESVTWSAAPPITTTTTTIIANDTIFYQLFLSMDMWGYLGPLALVIGGYFVAKKEKILGVLYFVVECLFVVQYIALVSATPEYWWHILILLLGGLFTCVYPLWDRRR